MAPTRERIRRMRKSNNAPRDRAWQAMRINPTFSIPFIVATAEISRENFMEYLTGLRNTGYVIKIRNKDPNRHEPAYYRLIRDTGPFRPHLQSDKHVYDRNISKEFAPQEASDG